MLVRLIPIFLGVCLLWPVAPSEARFNNCGNSVVNNDEECDDGNTSATDGCSNICRIYAGWTCTGSPSVCTPIPGACGNGIVDSGEECDDSNQNTRDGCSECTVEAGFTCTGAPSVCVNTSTVNCGDGVVDAGEGCDDGNLTSGDGCQSNCTVQPGYECSGAPSVCLPGLPGPCGDGIVNNGEECDGGPCCQEDCTLITTMRVCRAATGECDSPEFCNSTSGACPADNLRASTFVCRAATGSCDVAERCTGASDTCPTDTVQPAATVCRAAVSSACDVAETCSGAGGSCPEDVLQNCPDTDGLACTVPTCDVSGQCISDNQCNVICRSPNFWGKRAGGSKNGVNVIEEILEDVGPLQVCGQTITSADDVGDLGSAIEALCVRTGGNDERELYRLLVATALNCAISEGGDCDEIVGDVVDVSFSQCNALCAGQPVVDGPTFDECIDQLECFGAGGQLVNGECALGTCDDNPSEFCGADFGSCSTTSGSDDGDDDDGDDVTSLKASGNGHIGASGRGKGHGASGNGSSGNGNGNSSGSGDSDDGDDDDGDDDDGDDVEGDECEPFDDNCADARLCTTNADSGADVCPGKIKGSGMKLCQEARKNDCTIDDCN